VQKKPSAIRSSVSIEHRLVTDADRQTQGHSFYMRDAMLASKSYRILTVKEGQTLDKVVCVSTGLRCGEIQRVEFSEK